MNLTPGGLQLALQIGGRSGLWPRHRLPPTVGGGKGLLPRIEPVGFESQFLGDHFRRLAALQPVEDRFSFKRFVEFAADFDWGLVHVLVLSLFTQFSVRQFEATSIVQNVIFKNGITQSNKDAKETGLTKAEFGKRKKEVNRFVAGREGQFADF